MHYDGAAWSAMSSGTTDPLFGVWGSGSSHVFAVGGYGPYGIQGTIQHYDGIAWNPMSCPGYGLKDVWGSSGSDVFAVGEGGTILHYGSETHRVYLPLVLRNHAP
jgi:hypothetical protein